MRTRTNTSTTSTIPSVRPQLRIQGFKGRDLEIELAPRVVVSAPNGAGKSALADAIRFAALGYVPALGKRPADTAQLMRGGRLRVDLTLPGHGTLTRELSRAPRGTLAGSVECSWLKNARASEHHAAVLRLFGAEEDEVAEALDIRQLLAATPNQRAARIESLLASGTTPPEALAETVAELLVRRLAGKEDATLDGAHGWKSLLPALGAERPAVLDLLRQSSAMLLDKLRSGGLAAAAPWANEEKRRAANELRHAEAARAELERRLAEFPHADETRAAALAEERTRIDRELGIARAQADALTAKHRLRDQQANAVAVEESHLLRAQAAHAALSREQAQRNAVIEQALREIEAELSSPPPQVSAPVPETPPEFALAQELEAKLAAIEDPAPPDNASVQAKRATAEALEREANELHGKLQPLPDTSAERRRIESLRLRLAAVEASPWRQVLGIGEELAAIEHPTARSAADRLIALAHAQLEHNPEVLRGEIDEAERALAALEKSAAAINLANQILQAKITDLCDRAEVLRRESEDMRAAHEAEFARALNEARNRRAELLAEITILRAKGERSIRDARAAHEAEVARRTEARRRAIETRRQLETERERLAAAREMTAQAVARHNEALARAQAILAATDAELAAMPVPGDALALQARAQEIARELDRLSHAAATRVELGRLIDSIEKLGVERDTYSALEWAIQRAREREIAKSGSASAQILGRILAAAGRSEVPVLTAGEIGWVRPDGARVSVAALSGGEYALFTAALTAAVLTVRQAPVRILLVEAGEADAATLRQIMAGLSAVADQLTAALILTHLAVESVPEGWSLHRIEVERDNE